MKTALDTLKNTLHTVEYLAAIKGGNDENPNRPMQLNPRQLADRISQLNLPFWKKPRNGRP
jgi:hypothetical protein